MKEFRR